MIILASADEWLDPRTLIALVGTIIGLCGLLFGLLSHLWTRQESRLESLSKILQPLVRSAQFLFKANTNRRMCEQLKHSYPDPAKAPEAVQRINSLIDEYGKFMSASEVEFRNAEAEFAARHFRFPDGISRSVKSCNNR